MIAGGELNTTAAAVVQFAHLCADKGIASLDRTITVSYALTTEGEQYATLGLPERQVYASFQNEISMKEMQAHPLSRIAIGWMKKKGWVTIEKGQVKKTGDAPEGADEVALRDPDANREGILELVKRGLAEETETTTYSIAITEAGKALVEAGIDLREEVGTLTREQILSGDWKDLNLRRYSVDKLPKRIVPPGKIHPYQRLINEMRNVLLEMGGFIEIYGGDVVQSSFWNFDALFQPQDHPPAREMQDTFYLDSTTPPCRRTGSRFVTCTNTAAPPHPSDGAAPGACQAQTNVLRTHTTGLSIQYLKDHPDEPVKAFCIGRVYRREAIDPPTPYPPGVRAARGYCDGQGRLIPPSHGILKGVLRENGIRGRAVPPGLLPPLHRAIGRTGGICGRPRLGRTWRSRYLP